MKTSMQPKRQVASSKGRLRTWPSLIGERGTGRARGRGRAKGNDLMTG